MQPSGPTPPGVVDELERFVHAQQGVHARALAELRRGRKASHWMWFVFPQLRGLGRSEMAWTYGLASADEARRYGGHALLGARLRECTEAALAASQARGASAHDLFGSPDDLKLRSCLTLFEQVLSDEPLFGRALGHFFGGERDAATLARLAALGDVRGLAGDRSGR